MGHMLCAVLVSDQYVVHNSGIRLTSLLPTVPSSEQVTCYALWWHQTDTLCFTRVELVCLFTMVLSDQQVIQYAQWWCQINKLYTMITKDRRVTSCASDQRVICCEQQQGKASKSPTVHDIKPISHMLNTSYQQVTHCAQHKTGKLHAQHNGGLTSHMLCTLSDDKSHAVHSVRLAHHMLCTMLDWQSHMLCITTMSD